MTGGQNLYRSNVGLEHFPFSTVVPHSPDTINALNRMRGVASNPALLNNASNQMQRTLGGAYLGPNTNPYTAQSWQRQAHDVTNRVNTNAMLKGRVGSAAHQNRLTQQLGQLGQELYYNPYVNARNDQRSAMAQAPNLYSSMTLPADYYQQAGAIREALAQKQLQDQLARWDFSQKQPWARLGNYNNIVQGHARLGGSSSREEPYGQSRGGIAGAAGGALSGAATGAKFGPWGAAIGAIGGGIFGGLT